LDHINTAQTCSRAVKGCHPFAAARIQYVLYNIAAIDSTVGEVAGYCLGQ
jgi:hypothetical protein